MLLFELFDTDDEKPLKTWNVGSFVFNFYNEDGDQYIQATTKGDNLVGTLYFDRHPDHNKYVGSVEVESEYQRLGIANKLYDFAEDATNETFVPDYPHTRDAEAFWRNRIGDDNYIKMMKSLYPEFPN